MRLETNCVLAALCLALATTACSGNDDTEGGTGSSEAVGALDVVKSTPEAGATEVYTDADVRVTFSHDLDPDQPQDALVVRDERGAPAVGRLVVDRRTITFTPARYQANETYTAVVSADVSAGDRTLGENHEFTFETGTVGSDQREAPPDDFNPLGPGEEIPLGRVPEFGLLWTGSGDTHYAVEDPGYEPGSETNPVEGVALSRSLGEYASLQHNKLPIVGQLDDDGWDEIAVFGTDASGAPTLTILDSTGASDPTEVETGLSFSMAHSFDGVAADFDSDGRDELLLATSWAGEPVHTYLVDYDPDDEEYVVTRSWTAPEATASAAYVKVDAGDIDADAKVEVVVLWQIGQDAYYLAYDADENEEQMAAFRPVAENLESHDRCHEPFVDVTVGDVNGDGVAEVVFGVTEAHYRGTNGWFGSDVFADDRDCSIRQELRLAAGFGEDGAALPTPQLVEGSAREVVSFWYPNGWVDGSAQTRRMMSAMVAADLDGDLQDEIMLHNRLFKFDSGEQPALAEGWPLEIPDSIIHYGPSADDDWRPVDLSEGYLTRDVGVGDLDGDQKEDVVLLRKSGADVWIDHFDLSGPEESPFDSRRSRLQQTALYGGFAGEPRLALPNVDGDSVIVRPTGHDLYFGDDVILALLAAPPCSEEIGQDTGNCSTEFGQGTTESWSNGFYVDFSAGIVAGFEWEPKVPVPFLSLKLAKFELEVAAGVQVGNEHMWNTEVSEMLTFSAGADSHLVVFKTTVYDRYSYEIVAHPEADRVGDTMTLSVPAGQRLLAAPPEYYDARSERGLRVADLLEAVPGDPQSYPSRTEADALASSDGNRLLGISSQAVSAPVGTSHAVGLEQSVSTGESNDLALGVYLDVTTKTCGPDMNGWNPTICGGIQTSLSSGWAHSHEWSSDLVFAGSIGGIAEEQHAEEVYAAGLVAYETSLTGKDGEEQRFIVVSYFVE